jgi:uncharacterized metal-binding protein YceD (DUF177 family)
VKVTPAQLPPEGKAFSGEEPAAILDLAGDPNVRIESAVVYRLRAQLVCGELVVRGTASAKLKSRCSRCAQFFDAGVLEAGFDACLHVENPLQSVDLTEDIRESIILAFPTYPVCSPACKGLCAQCGADLNVGTCACRPPADGRWHALDGLNVT